MNPLQTVSLTYKKESGTDWCYIGTAREIRVSKFADIQLLKGESWKDIRKSFGNTDYTGAGYLSVYLPLKEIPSSKRSIRVHRIMAITWLGYRDRPWQVNHKDGNRINNCLDNIEWVLPADNIKNAKDRGVKFGYANEKVLPISFEQYEQIIKDNRTRRDIAKDYGLDPSTVSRIKTGDTYMAYANKITGYKFTKKESRKVTQEDVNFILENTYLRYSLIAEMLGISRAAVRLIALRITNKDLIANFYNEKSTLQSRAQEETI